MINSVLKPKFEWQQNEKGIYNFSVTYKGLSGKEWFNYFTSLGKYLTMDDKLILESDDFKPRPKGETDQVFLLSRESVTRKKFSNQSIRAEARKRRYLRPSLELSCVLLDMITDEDLSAIGIKKIINMHKGVILDGNPRLLDMHRYSGMKQIAYYDLLDYCFPSNYAFAFLGPK